MLSISILQAALLVCDNTHDSHLLFIMYHHAANVLISTSMSYELLYAVLSSLAVAVDHFNNYKHKDAHRNHRMSLMCCIDLQLYSGIYRAVLRYVYVGCTATTASRSVNVLLMITLQHQLDLYNSTKQRCTQTCY
jgi:hypothetical protein